MGTKKSTFGKNSRGGIAKSASSAAKGTAAGYNKPSSGSSSIIQANTTGSRADMLANAQAQVANINKMMSDPSTKLSPSQRDSIAVQLGTASTELAKIPKATAPVVASDVKNNIGETQTTNTEPYLGDTTDSTAYSEKVGAQLTREQQVEKDKQDKLERERQFQQENQPFLDKMMKTFSQTQESMADTMAQQNEAFNDYLARAEASRAEIKTYNDKYAEVEAAMLEQINKTQDSMGSMNFINNQIAQIKRSAEPDLTLLAAKSANASADLALLQGDYKMADTHLQNAIQNITALAKFEYESYKDFYTINQDNFSRVESIYSDAFKQRMEIAKQQYDDLRAEKQLIGEYMLKNATAGIKITDSLEEVARKIAAVAKKSGIGSAEAQRRAKMVLNGQAALTDYTTAEQAEIKDAIWGLSAADMGYVNAPMSYLPGESPEQKFEALRMRVAGPGTGTTQESVGELTPSAKSDGVNWIYNNGGTVEDVQKFETDRAFQAWVLNQV